MPAAKRTVIETANTFQGRQSWNYREIFKQGDHKIRVDIKIDSYDFQSHARAEVWNEKELKWNVVHHIPYSNIVACKKVSYVQRTCDVLSFKADRDLLVKMAEQVLF